MRIATYNVEWFTHLFDATGALLEDDGPSGRWHVSRAAQLGALCTVFAALDADAIMVIEAPDDGRNRRTTAMLEAFAARAGIRASRALVGFANETQQEIALLYDPLRIEALHDPQGEPAPPVSRAPGEGAPRFDQSFRIDLDIDATLDTVRFSKPPLEVLMRVRDSERILRLIGVHVKSKAPHGVHDPVREVRVQIQNRRKQLAQCIWIRRRVDDHLDRCEDLVVLGDFNDGPGLDEYEALFGRSGLEIVLGHDEVPIRRLHDPNARGRATHSTAAAPVSARFWSEAEQQYFSAMLDYVMVSPSLLALRPRWRIFHPFDDPQIYAEPRLRDALLVASDHFPVLLELPL